MGITYNSGAVNAVTYNSNALQRVTYNGNEVWSNAPSYPPYLTFFSAGPFVLENVLNVKTWDGTIEYSTDKTTWAAWDGTQIPAVRSNDTYYVYVRGSGNTYITGNSDTGAWYFSASIVGGVHCNGDIRTLLNYADPENITMAQGCFAYLFYGNDALVTPPSLPMATISITGCRYMFASCTALDSLPALHATQYKLYCCSHMFDGCSRIKVSATQSGEYVTPYSIPAEGVGTAETYAFDSIFANTGGTYTMIAAINTTYYTSNTVVS